MEDKRPSKTAKVDAKLRALYLLSIDGDKTSYRQFLEGVQLLVQNFYQYSSFKAAFSNEKKEDLVQDVLVKIHKNKEAYNPSYPITPWIYSIAKNHIIDAIRTERETIEFKEDLYQSEEIEQLEYSIALQDEIEKLTEKMPAKQKEILLLSKYYGLTSEEISKRLDMKLSAIKVSIFRSISSLKKKKKVDKNE